VKEGEASTLLHPLERASLNLVLYCNDTKIFKLFLCIDVHGFGCWVSFRHVFSTSCSISVSGLHTHFHNFSYLPLTKPDLRYILYMVQCSIQSDRLPELSDSKIWSWVLWDLKPRMTALARASSNLLDSCWIMFMQLTNKIGGGTITLGQLWLNSTNKFILALYLYCTVSGNPCKNLPQPSHRLPTALSNYRPCS
jgi:hypothetical protein